jgi:ATP-binding cassette subfamily B protein
MNSSAESRHAARGDDMPPALRSLLRTVRFGYRAEPKLLVASFGVVVVTAIPDVLVGLWLKILADGVADGSRTKLLVAGFGLAVSAVGMWLTTLLSQRVERRFRDRVGIALESHVAELQARVATIEHHERPEYLDRLSILRDQVFALDHLFCRCSRRSDGSSDSCSPSCSSRRSTRSSCCSCCSPRRRC